MPTITMQDEYRGREATDWQEFRHGERHPVAVLIEDDSSGSDEPVDLSDYTVSVIAEEILVDVAQSTPPSRTDPAGKVELTNPRPTNHPIRSLTATKRTQSGDDVGYFDFVLPDPRSNNPSFGQTMGLPALMIWVAYESGDAKDNTVIGIFYRRGAPLAAV